MAAFTLNGRAQEVAVNGDTPLLWVRRKHLRGALGA
jgi:aerobic-type carbon monoxide dehydrogenase small subunit (CoxS/CutS family)